MSIISRRFDKKETGTVFRHAESGKILYRLDARLERDDWEMLQALISLVYNAGVAAGSEQRAADIREALGFKGLNDTEKR
ncbi:hypothetical protein [Citrobacter portucalensis]|uniref:hypothetical protein n=1 Tax=Citrobacter portucalensis TaxID=1639133 RepID=UPI001F1918AB|nr:hypothetical protein [Citrobacter portucalensis]